MSCACNENDAHLQSMRDGQARMLWIVLAINTVMFVVEFTAGWLASSTALLADSLDMLGDSLVYGLSLFVVAKSMRWKAVSAGFKGAVMLGFGVLVLGDAVFKAVAGLTPEPTVMAVVALIALVANIVCLALLTRHRGDDVNMRSSWICSRNDLFANSGVVLAAIAVALTGSVWPDVLAGAVIAGLFLVSSIGVLRDARANYAAPAQAAVEQ